MQLPLRIRISNKPIKQALKYFITIIATYAISSMAFSGMIPFGIYVGFGSIALGILTMILVYKKDKRTKRTIEITEEGIVEVKSSSETFIRWNESHQTYYDGTEFNYAGIIPIGTLVSTQVVAKGKAIKIDYPDSQFHEAILSLSFKHSFPLIKKQLEEQKRVYFGSIELDQNHIFIKNKKYSRTDIKKVQVVKGKLSLKLKSKWLPTKVMVRDIPNLSCLVMIVSENLNQ